MLDAQELIRLSPHAYLRSRFSDVGEIVLFAAAFLQLFADARRMRICARCRCRLADVKRGRESGDVDLAVGYFLRTCRAITSFSSGSLRTGSFA